MYTIICILVCISLSAVLCMSEQAALKQRMSLKGFVTERKIRADHIYLTLLSIEPTQSIHFMLPIQQKALVIQIGDLVQVSYDQVPFVLFKPICVRTLEIIESNSNVS